MLFFCNNTILSCSFFFSLIIDFLIPKVFLQIYNPIAGLVMPIGIPTIDKKVEIETH